MSSPQEMPPMAFKPCLSDNSSGVAVIVLDAIFLALSALAIAIRLYGRHAQKARLVVNDYAVLIAWPLTAGLCVTGILAVCPGGGGRHILEVNPLEITGTLKGYIAAELLWAAANVAVKISILHLYRQIFGQEKTFRLLCYAMMGFVVAFGISIILIPFSICQPFAKNWNPLMPGYCGNTIASITATSAINMAVDLTIIAMPMPLIWRLQTSKNRKVSLTILFSLGLVVCIITVLRLVTSLSTEITDFTWPLAKLAVYSDMEPLLGIIVACLPVFPIAFKHMFRPETQGSSRNAIVNSLARWHTKHLESSGRRRHADSILLSDVTHTEPISQAHDHKFQTDHLPLESGITIQQGWKVTTDTRV